MFKVIKLDFYDDFRCMMSECPDNCCDEDWDIYIDDETIEKYRKLGIEDLDLKITVTEPHKLIKKDKKCPFITSEGLCSFHRDYGEEYLSNTCRSYPRFVSTYGDVYVETLGMSCPATVQHVISFDKPIVFPEKIYYERQEEIGRILMPSDAEKTARSVISCFDTKGSMIKSYIEAYEIIFGEHLNISIGRDELISTLSQITRSTPSERYFIELFEGHQIEKDICNVSIMNAPTVLKTEELLSDYNSLFCCNVNRMWLFEHLMLEYKNDAPDLKGVMVEGVLSWVLLLIAIEGMLSDKTALTDSEIIDSTYRIMRVTDHGPLALKSLKNRSFELCSV